MTTEWVLMMMIKGVKHLSVFNLWVDALSHMKVYSPLKTEICEGLSSVQLPLEHQSLSCVDPLILRYLLINIVQFYRFIFLIFFSLGSFIVRTQYIMYISMYVLINFMLSIRPLVYMRLLVLKFWGIKIGGFLTPQPLCSRVSCICYSSLCPVPPPINVINILVFLSLRVWILM